MIRRVRRIVRPVVAFESGTDDWRREVDHRWRKLHVLFLTFRVEHQTKPDERWHFSLALRDHDGTGWHGQRGWARQGESKHYCVLGHVAFYVSFSVRPFYKIVYAPSWIQSVARLTSRHPIEVAEHYVKEGHEIAAATPVEADAESVEAPSANREKA